MKRRSTSRFISFALIFSMVLSIFAVPVSQYASAAEGTFQDLIISEYIEGGSFNKALELYNGTENEIDLANYTLELYSNGETTPQYSLPLEGKLATGEVFVIAHEKSNQSILDKADVTNQSVVNFNGNDVVVLKKTDSVIDSIGQVGSAGDFAKDMTLVRKGSVKSGDTDTTDAVDITKEWTQYAKDTTDYLGAHQSDGTAPDPDPEPIELSTITDARKVANGTQVKIKGIATASFETGSQTNLFIQDDTAAIIVRAAGITAQPGDEVTVEGAMSDYFGMQQVQTSASNVIITTEDKGIPSPQSLKSTDLSKDNGEQHEAAFTQFNDVTVKSVDGNGNFTVEDASGEFVIKPTNKSLLEVGKTYEILKGVIDYNYNEYKLVPRSAADVIETAFSVTANPASGAVIEGTMVKLATAEEGATVHYTTDGSEPTAESTEYTAPIELTEDTTIKAVAAKDGKLSEVATFDYTVLKSADGISIHDIQGSDHASPYEGMAVTKIAGIVTAKDGNNAFYMQEENPDDSNATSEGIYVYKSGGAGVNVGDKVEVNGQVKEYKEDGYSDAKDLLTTQITASSITVASSGNTLPEAIVIGTDRTPPTEIVEDDEMKSFDPETDGLDFYESLEGMLIEIPDANVTGPVKYDELPVYVNTSEDQLLTRANGLLLSAEDPNPERLLIDVDGIDIDVKTGDRLDGSVTGIVSYDYSNFKIRPTGTFPSVIDGKTEREVTKMESSEGDLTVASYNIENYYPGVGEEKTGKIAESIVKNMKTPDIVGLVEVQDNNGPTDDGTTSANESYEAIIQAIEEAGGPTYKFTEIAPEDKTDGGQPGGNIRVGFIYNPDRVNFSEKKSGDVTTSVGVDENGLTLNPGRIDPTNEAFEDSRKSLAAEFEFNGEKVVVVANHFNSKGGDGALFGADHPVVLGSEVQRVKQASILNNFVNDVVTNMDNGKVVVLGDLNDFEFSKPIQTLEGDVLTNMVKKLPTEQRYSYNYQGNAQVLDHILVSNNLANRTMIDSININSDFSEADGRASDHDPMLAKIQMNNSVDRTSGETRYETAVEVSKKGWESAETVVIARGDKFPDALAGAPLAYKYDAPILLTEQNKLNTATKKEIKRLGAKKAIVLGGTSAISSYTEYELKGLGLKVDRIGGETRYETAVNIAAKLDGNPEKSILANAFNFPDALSVASYAAKNGYPIVLTDEDELPAVSKKILNTTDEQIVVGGESAVNEKIKDSLSNAVRISGENRYATSAAIATMLTPDADTAIVATGVKFADALTGSVLAAKEDAAILLVKKDEVPEKISEAIDENDIHNFHILGGPNAVSDDVMNDLKNN
ncbi:cell wall-binding repeat-containing protein [Guptibacillus hwajinpoensis]|uniref:cell wall-binding repeat-containing protein n=1 Tax=Guptibacillus hwajinpoensis TaxID=208199 RepID=UPI001CFE2580|nr:cell wall-binding repeat-containing protein [Pseudalkalibacillus hwajinpoensis]WLR61613.1 cell wall-binding repeat-containing protein [Pseudalkalibacillus hwajinpoensis]